jgi:hypothetical protein
MKHVFRLGLAALCAPLVAALFATGCGTPGAPLPPSLNLPDAVTNLAATRTGNQVALIWTMPKKNTDKMLVKGKIPVRVCRRVATETCAPAGDLQLDPGSEGTFTETLPPALSAGAPRALRYFVELKNPRGRSAGLSNAAVVLAGEAPAPVAGLAAQVRKDGVVLHWTADSENAAIRLHRKLLTPPAAAKSQPGVLAPSPEPLEQNLLVDQGAQADRTLDSSIRFGETYEYRAQRVTRVTLAEKTPDGQTKSQTLELVGPLSDAVRVEALDIFPPAVPTGLAAVATAGDANGGPSIDLSWQPVTDADLAGYAVYRRESGSAWQRISPTQPVVGPGFHDANVQPGHTYTYAVSAIDQSVRESARSVEAEETAPNP